MPGLIITIMVLAFIGCFFWFLVTEEVLPPLIVAVLVAVFGGGFLINDYLQIETRTIVVEGKDRGGDDGSYRVYVVDGDTLAVKDMHFPGAWRTNSADMYGDIPICHELVVEVRGWEFGPASLMPNIWRVVEDRGPVEGCVQTV